MKNKKTNEETTITNELSKPLDTANDSLIISDVDGSYTGHPIDGGKPVQDADDL
jgi:hypothetical protein